MSYTFLKAQGYEVGKSLLEADQIPQVSAVLAEADRRGVEVVLPVDLVAADRLRARRRARGGAGSASSPPTGRAWTWARRPGSCSREKLADAKTVFWNGPVGVFEFPAFAGRHPGGRRGDQPR